jgi:hypothetical protein
MFVQNIALMQNSQDLVTEKKTYLTATRGGNQQPFFFAC